MQSTLRSIFKDKNVSLCVFTGKQFENTEMFGQYPLQVNGFKDLHECLEAAMIEGEIESLHSAENSAKSGQEVCRGCLFFFYPRAPQYTQTSKTVPFSKIFLLFAV